MPKGELQHEGGIIKVRAIGQSKYETFQGQDFHPMYYSFHQTSSLDKEHVVGMISVGHGVPLKGGEADIVTQKILLPDRGHEILQSVINNARKRGRKQVIIKILQDREWIESILKKIGVEHEYVEGEGALDSHIRVQL